MFHGSTIDELMGMVERAEEHARVDVAAQDEVHAAPQLEVLPGFFGEWKQNNNVWVGVA